MFRSIALLAFAAALFVSPALAQPEKPTVVLVHGAFAGSSSWDGVIKVLQDDGYPVIAEANPLRTLAGDAGYLASLLSSVKTPIVLVGHSYGGAVISEAANGIPDVKALVFVTAIAPDVGESVNGLSNKFPGSTIGGTLAPPVILADGGQYLYIEQSKFHEQFAGDNTEGGDAGGADRTRHQPRLEDHPVVVHLRRCRQEHSAGGKFVHGRAGKVAEDGHCPRRLAPGDGVASRCGGRADQGRRSRQIASPNAVPARPHRRVGRPWVRPTGPACARGGWGARGPGCRWRGTRRCRSPAPSRSARSRRCP